MKSSLRASSKNQSLTCDSSSSELAGALVKLYRDNASTLTPDPVYAAFYYSHPPALERITRLRQAANGPRLQVAGGSGM